MLALRQVQVDDVVVEIVFAVLGRHRDQLFAGGMNENGPQGADLRRDMDARHGPESNGAPRERLTGRFNRYLGSVQEAPACSWIEAHDERSHRVPRPRVEAGGNTGPATRGGRGVIELELRLGADAKPRCRAVFTPNSGGHEPPL